MVQQALRVVLVVAIALLPAASARTAVFSADDKVRGSVGLLGEPVATYAVTGLDLCFSENGNATPPPAVNVGNAGAFTASLTAPDGRVHQAGLVVPADRPDCLAFADPLVLTQPGQYLISFSGTINGTTFDEVGVKAGEVLDRAALTFPDDGVASNLALGEQIAALQARIASLEAAAAQPEEVPAEDQFAPGAPLGVLLAGLAAVAMLRRRA